MVESSKEDFSETSPSTNDVVQALRQTSKGKLVYDTDWKGQGRTREIVESVKKKVSAITVSPKAIKQTRSLSFANLGKYNLTNNVNENHGDNKNNSNKVSIFDLFYQDTQPDVDYAHKDYQLDIYEQHRKKKVEKRLEALLNQKAQEKERLRREQEQELKKIERNSLKKEVDFESRLDEMDNFMAQLTLQLNQAIATTTTGGAESINLKLKEVHERTQLMQKQEQQRKHEQERLRRVISDKLLVCQKHLSQCQTNFEEFKKLGSQDIVKIIQADFEHFTNSIKILVEEISILLSKNNLTEQDVELSTKNVDQVELFTKTTQDRLAQAIMIESQARQQQIKTCDVGNVKPLVGELNSKPADEASSQIAAKTTTSSKQVKRSTFQSPRSRYLAYKQELAEFDKLCQKFLDSTQTPAGKKRRADLQIFTRSTINVISSSSTSHLREQLRKLLHLFNGETVIKEGGTKIVCNKNDYSYHFAINNAAKHFVDVCTKMKNVALQLAQVIIILWTYHVEFGRLFLCHLSISCPYVIPYFPVLEPDQSEEDYLKTLGYKMQKAGGAEPEESFTERVTACIELYAMVMQCKIETVLGVGEIVHPHNLKHAWRWLAEILNGEIAPEMTALILESFLRIAYREMFIVYGSQFQKIIVMIKFYFIPKIEKTTEVTQRATLMKLKSTLSEIEKERK